MAMRELIEGDCGITNPLLKVASHYTQEKGPQVGQPSSASASNQLVKEFLLENNEAERLAPQTFNMESLLNEMSEIDEMYHRPPQPTENYINRENEWVQNFQQSYNLAYENNRLNALDSLDNTWADEFLITSEQDIQNQRGLGNDWAQNFKAQSCSEITEIATGLSESVTDPKISESKFMRFIKKVGEGEVDLTQLEKQDTKNIADIWSSDFAATWTTPVENLETAWDGAAQSTSDFKTSIQTEDEKEEEAKNDADFWDTLQKEWEKMAK